MKKLLQSGDLHHARTAERLEGIVRKSSAPGIAADFSVDIVSGKPRKAHGTGLDTSNARAKRIRAATRACNYLLEIHLHFFEKVFWQVAAMETHGLVGIVSVIVVPVE